MKKPNRQTLRTRNLLRDALIELILERGFDAISVQDITNTANVGRATFYKHYKDKEDLLLNALLSEYQEILESIFPEGKFPQDRIPIQEIFEHAETNRDLFLAVFYTAGKTAAYRQARDFIAQQTKDVLNARFTKVNVPLDVAVMYFSGALLSLVIWWLEAGMPYPPSVMEEMVFQLAVAGSLED